MSKMDLFIDIELKSDEYLREITQEQYVIKRCIRSG